MPTRALTLNEDHQAAPAVLGPGDVCRTMGLPQPDRLARGMPSLENRPAAMADHEKGPRAVYKGASPPAVGWAASDSILMGSLHKYRLFFTRWRERDAERAGRDREDKLPLRYHAVSFGASLSMRD